MSAHTYDVVDMMTVNNHPVVLERVVGNSVHTVIYSDYKGRYVCDSYALHVSP